MEDSRPIPRRRSRRRSPASDEQMAARGELADARKNELSRKKRTRELITMGGVLAAHGFETPEQVDELMEALSKRESWVGWLRRRGVDLGRAE